MQVSLALGAVSFVGMAVALYLGSMIVVSCAVFTTGFFAMGSALLLLHFVFPARVLRPPRAQHTRLCMTRTHLWHMRTHI